QEYNLANFYFCALFAGALMILARHIRGKSRDLRKVKIFDALILFLFLILFLLKVEVIPNDHPFFSFFNRMGWIYVALIAYFIREFSNLTINFNKDFFNPAQIITASFLSLILL